MDLPGQFVEAGWSAAEGAQARGNGDWALRVTVGEEFAEIVGAVLMEVFGPFEIVGPLPIEVARELVTSQPGETQATDLELNTEHSAASVGRQKSGATTVTLVFYPPARSESAGSKAIAEEVRELLPGVVREATDVQVDSCWVTRGWADAWKTHFLPIVIEAVRVRPPWEVPARAPLVDVAINPGLGFGTGLHPTTRGVLMLQKEGAGGLLTDVGTGSGILAVAAAKLGWATRGRVEEAEWVALELVPLTGWGQRYAAGSC